MSQSETLTGSHSTYRFDAGYISHLLDDLKQQNEAGRLSPAKRILFNLLQVCAFLVPGSIFAVWVWGENHEVVGGIALVVFYVAILGLVVLLFLNLPFLRSAWKQLILSHKLDLVLPDESTVNPPWVVRRERRKRMKWLAVGLVAVIAASLWEAMHGDIGAVRLVAVVVAFGVPLYLIFSGRSIPMVVLQVGLWSLLAITVGGVGLAFLEPDHVEPIVLALVLVVVPGLVLTLGRFLHRVGTRLALVDSAYELDSKFSREPGAEPESGFLEVSEAEAARLAQIEKAVIANGRRRAIATARETRGTGYAIFKQPDARAQLDRLGSLDRLAVESRILDLIYDSKPAEAVAVDGDRLRIEVPNMPYQVIYAVAEKFRQISIVAIEGVPSAGEKTDD